jgi:hypothetical protein
MTTDFSRVFTLEVDGLPTLAFEASRTKEAQEICKESWLRSDLILLKSDGVPLCAPQSKLSVRPATAEEAIFFEQAAAAAKPSDDMVLVYLIDLDV